jgi:hypothetical protein
MCASPRKRQRKKATVQKSKTIPKVKPKIEEPNPFDDWLLDEEQNMQPTPNHKTTTEPEPKVTATGTKENPDLQPSRAQRNMIEPVDTSDTRSFQTGVGPDGRENLTKEEARAKGFHWLETEDELAKSKGKKKDD